MNTTYDYEEVVPTKNDPKEDARRAERDSKGHKYSKKQSGTKGGYKRTTRNNPRYGYNGE